MTPDGPPPPKGAESGEAPTDCVFCGIGAGTQPAHVVYEDDRVIAFLDIAPATPGHTLVVPKRHAADLLAIDPDDLSAVAAATQQVARLLDERLSPDGLTVVQANRAAGWQSVPHLHMHVVPRRAGDPLRLPWHPQRRPGAVLAEIADRLRLLDGTYAHGVG